MNNVGAIQSLHSVDMYGAKEPIQEKRVGVKVHNVGDIKCHFLTWNWKQRLGRGSTPVCVHQPGKHGKGKELVPILCSAVK